MNLLRLVLALGLLLPTGAQVGTAPLPVRMLHPRGRWMVDRGGAGDFRTLQQAIDAAGSGDLIVVRSDLPVTNVVRVVGKGLTIVGEGARKKLTFQDFGTRTNLVVRGVPGSAHVVFRNLDIAGYLADFEEDVPPLVELVGNRGAVWFEDCDVTSVGPFAVSRVEREAVHVEDSSRLVLVRTRVAPSGSPEPPRAALMAVRSSVHVFESEVLGADGTASGTCFACCCDPTPGGHAVVLRDSFLYASGCTLRGGAGQKASCVFSQPCLDGESGGIGLDVDAGSEAHLVATSVEGGAASSGCSTCVGGPPGEAVVALGLFEDLGGTARTFQVRSPLREGNATLTATGPVGDLVLSLVGTRPAGAYLPLHAGVQLVAPPFAIRNVGTIPAGGVLSSTFPAPPVPPLTAFSETFRQGFFFDSAGTAFLGSASVVVSLAD